MPSTARLDIFAKTLAKSICFRGAKARYDTDGKNEEDGAFRCHLLFVCLFVLRNEDIGEQILRGNFRSSPDRRTGAYVGGGKRKFTPKYGSQDYHSQGTVGVSPNEAVIISCAAVISIEGA